MPPVTPTQAEVLVQSNPAALPRGKKEAAIRDLMNRTGASRAKVYRMLREVTVRAPRKPRLDKGARALPLKEAQIISAWLMDGLRKNGKRLRSIAQALQELRYAGLVRAERIDASTGEITLLSDSAVSDALKTYGLHPDQLLRPAPAAAMQSLHPNHVWEIDASLCVLYYLKTSDASRKAKATGLQVMDADKFYKNKPKALERIESERVWRYLCVDHYSGSIFCLYVLGAESGHNLVEAFIHAITPRTLYGQANPFCGVPFVVYMDPGSANTGALFKNLARRLQVRVLVHAPGNARATGGVERPHDIWERAFESTLRSEPIHTLDQLNEAAEIYARYFNASRTHTRHGHTRTDMWLTISDEHKRVAPPMEMLRLLATHHPEERKVEAWPGPVVRFAGKVYDVSQIPDVMIGEKLSVTYSPYVEGHACIVTLDAQGNEALALAPEVQFNEAGFPVTASVLGEEYRRPADTVLQTNRKLIERLAMGAQTDQEAAASRRAKKATLDGTVRPLAQARETILPTPLPKRGTELKVRTSMPVTLGIAQEATLTVPRAAIVIKSRLGDAAPADLYMQIKTAFPDGHVPQTWVDQWGQTPEATGTHDTAGRSPLRVVT